MRIRLRTTLRRAQVRFVRKRFGQYEVIDFLALLFGYAISGDRTVQAFFDRLHPFAEPFMPSSSGELHRIGRRSHDS